MITPGTWILIRWWRDWNELNSLPYGGNDVLQQPAFVGQSIRVAVQTQTEIAYDRQEKRRREDEQYRAKMKALGKGR